MYDISIMQGELEAFLTKLSQAVPDRVNSVAQSVKLQEEVKELLADVAKDVDIVPEIADVIIVCLVLANLHGAAVEEVLFEVENKLVRNAQRDWYPTESGTARHTPEVML